MARVRQLNAKRWCFDIIGFSELLDGSVGCPMLAKYIIWTKQNMSLLQPENIGSNNSIDLKTDILL